MGTFHCKKVATYGHLIAFRYIFLQYRIILDSFRYKVIPSGYYFISIFKLDVHDDLSCDFTNIYIQMGTFHCKEVAAYSHLIAFRHIFFQYRIVLDSFRYKVVASGNHFISILELNVHNDLSLDLLNIYIQVRTFHCEEIAAYSHLIAFRHIFFQYRIVLDSFRYKVVASSDHFISILKLDVHDDVFLDLLYAYIQMCPFFCKEVAAYGHLVSFRYILL